MQNLTKIINKAKTQGADNNQILNLVREYLQVLILKAIYQSKYGSGLSFMGGTCLRICYDLKRYSEDLDFALDKKIPDYSFQELNEIIASFLKNTDFEVDIKMNDENIVHKSFIRVSKVLHLFGLSPLESQKIHVKLKIDSSPVKISDKETQTFFVTKFNEMFPILMHSDETLFAGKICAVLNRAYTKGRDFYDLLWYLNKQTDINVSYINKAMKQGKIDAFFKNKEEVLEAVDAKVKGANTVDILKDIDRFLEDSEEKKVLEHYPAAFMQAYKKYFEG